MRYRDGQISAARRDENKKDLTGGGAGGILNNTMTTANSTVTSGGISGSLSGALNPYSEEADKHAKTYYATVRRMKDDAKKVAGNTGFSEEQIKSIKEHLFLSKHDLGRGTLEYFAPDYEIAQSWQRLIEGKNIESHDIVLLKHELLERDYMAQGLSQDVAHRKAEEKYNYANLVKERQKNGLARNVEKR